MPDSVTFTSDPAPEVLSYFRNKGIAPSFNWRDVWGEEHAHAFTVAKAMKMDVLTTLRDAVDKAIAEGQSFEQFREGLEPRLKDLGWWGRKDMTDPESGKPVKARLGSPRRLKVIYDSNLRSANAAGAWARAQRTKDLLPFFRYELGPSMVHRPHHVARRGMTYPVDHPIWNEWYPPNGWGCKCWLRQILAEEAVAVGWTPDAPEPDIPYSTYINRRTGETVDIPEGIDPGWHTNPGKVRGETLRALLSERLETIPEDMRDIVLKDTLDSWLFGKLKSGEIGEGAVAPLAIAPVSLTEGLGVVRCTVWIEGAVAARNAGLTREDWTAVQTVLTRGRIEIMEAGSAVITGEAGGASWRLTIGRGGAGLSELRLHAVKRTGNVARQHAGGRAAESRCQP